MSRDDWEQAIARAVVERSFRARLLADPADTLADYGLRDSQRHVVAEMRASSLNEFAAHILRIATSIFDPGFDAFALESERL
jgi:hypothetical protein